MCNFGRRNQEFGDMDASQTAQTPLLTWVLTLTVIAIVYALVMARLEHRLQTLSEFRASAESDGDEAYVAHKILSDRENARKMLLWRLLATVVILAVISVLPIPLSEGASRQGLVLLLMLLFYLKSLMPQRGLLTLAHLSDNDQTRISQDDVQRWAQLGGIRASAERWLWLHRLLSFTVLESRKDLQAPATKALLAVHRTTYLTAILLGLAAVLMPTVWTLYLCILWAVQLVGRGVGEFLTSRGEYRSYLGDAESGKMLRHVWLSILSFLIFAPLFTLIPQPSYTQSLPLLSFPSSPSSKTTPDSTEVATESKAIAIPADIEGLYFVLRADGVKVSGATARIESDHQGGYIIQVYSDQPTRRFSMRWDCEDGVLRSEVLGEGRIKHDKKIKSTEINFSDIWVLTN